MSIRNLGTMDERLTYKQTMSKREVKSISSILFRPILTMVLGIFVISNLGQMGTIFICPIASITWFICVIVAFIMKNMRKETLNQSMNFLITYFSSLYSLKLLIGFVSGVSPEMVAATYDQALTSVVSNSIAGTLQNMLYITGALGPLGIIGMQIKRLVQFRASESIAKKFKQVRGVRVDSRDHPHYR